MSLTRKIGELLVALDNATVTVFGDDACITHIIPSPRYEDDGTILDITISVMLDNLSEDEYSTKMDIFDELIYNSVFNYTDALLKVNITFKEVWFYG